MPDFSFCMLMLLAFSYSKARLSPITIDKREKKDDKTKIKDRYYIYKYRLLYQLLIDYNLGAKP